MACNVARGEDSAVLSRFLALSPKAEAYFNALRQRDLHAPGHARRILLLAGIHGHAACLQKHSVLITTNIAYKEWPRIFASDATMTSALLDRLSPRRNRRHRGR